MKCLYLLFILSINFTVVIAQETEVVRINTDLVQTAVTVLDKKGNSLAGATASQLADFIVR